MAHLVDARGLLCPLPRLHAGRAVARLAPGETVVVLADDPEAAVDLGALAVDAGLELARRDHGAYVGFHLRRPAAV